MYVLLETQSTIGCQGQYSPPVCVISIKWYFLCVGFYLPSSTQLQDAYRGAQFNYDTLTQSQIEEMVSRH